MSNDGVVCVLPALLQKIGERVGERWRDVEREGLWFVRKEKNSRIFFVRRETLYKIQR